MIWLQVFNLSVIPCLYFLNSFKTPSFQNFWVAPVKGSKSYKDSKGNLDKCGRKTNPTCFGNFSPCAIYQSIYHWGKKCCDQYSEDSSSNIKVTLFSKNIYECYKTKSAGETLNDGVFYTGFTQNVCSSSWLKPYLASLTATGRFKV